MSKTDETREALNDVLDAGGYTGSLTRWEAALAAHERAVKAEAVAEVVEFLDSQTGPDEIVGWSRNAARSVQWWADATPYERETERKANRSALAAFLGGDEA
jgi:hypothetical protein